MRAAQAGLSGCEPAEIWAALARHAPDVPVIDELRTDDGTMTEVGLTVCSWDGPALARPGAARPS
jgi:hypothetical protein